MGDIYVLLRRRTQTILAYLEDLVVTEIEAKNKPFLILYQTQKEGNAWNSDLDLLPLSV